MRITLKYFVKLCLGLFVTGSVVLAQTLSTPDTSIKTTTAVRSARKVPRSKADKLRRYQLRVLREHVLTRVLDSIKKTDEPALRLSARNEVLRYLASDKTPSDEKQALATQLANDAITDLREHGEEIIPFVHHDLPPTLKYWIAEFRPDLSEDFEKTVKANEKFDASKHIRSLFELQDGDILAAKRIRQELEEQGPLNQLHTWLDQLMRRNSEELEPLASNIVARAEQGQISFETLFSLSDIYLRPQTSDALRNRFLATVIARTKPANFTVEPPSPAAYNLLTRILPFVQRSIPELYDQALNQNVAIGLFLTERQSTINARIKRLKESANPIEDLISEAESVKSKAERNELLLDAAELALEKKRFDLCLDVLDNIDVNIAAADPDFWQGEIDRISKNSVWRIISSGKGPELAEKAANRIASLDERISALHLIISYGVKDKAEAQRLLAEASKVAALVSDETERAMAFFLLSSTCERVDRSRKASFLLSGIKALDNVARPDAGARDKTNYRDYIGRLNYLGHGLTLHFNELTKQDEYGALALVDKLQKPDFRTFALIGILSGLEELLKEPA